MLYPDYTETKRIYHIISIIDLDKTLKYGIKFDDKKTYKTKYYGFHDFIDRHRTREIPEWVIRKKAIFGSLNFADNHHFHSHTAVLSIRIKPEKCWIANENLVNHLYEPFIISNIDEFEKAKLYLQTKGKEILREYWNTSLSFNDNLRKRYDLMKGYDAEVLILHDIQPSDIEVLYIVSDHSILTKEEWKKTFCKE